MFKSDTTSKYEAISSMLGTVVPQILDEIDKLRDITEKGETVDASTYMYERHSNIGMYRAVAVGLHELLTNPIDRQDLVKDYNKKHADSQISIQNVEEIYDDLNRLISLTQAGIDVLNILLKRNVTK